MASRLSTILLGALAAIPAFTDAASVTIPRQEADSNPGFISFPVKRGERSSKTLSGRQATASLVNEQDTSYVIECSCNSTSPHVLGNVPSRDQNTSFCFPLAYLK